MSCLVHLYVICRKHAIHLCNVKWVKLIGCTMYPAVYSGSGNIHSKWFETFGLPVFWDMVKKFIYNDLAYYRLTYHTSRKNSWLERGLKNCCGDSIFFLFHFIHWTNCPLYPKLCLVYH